MNVTVYVHARDTITDHSNDQGFPHSFHTLLLVSKQTMTALV